MAWCAPIDNPAGVKIPPTITGDDTCTSATDTTVVANDCEGNKVATLEHAVNAVEIFVAAGCKVSTLNCAVN